MTEIDLTPWGDYLRAFTAMQRSLADGDPITAQFKRREMLALINASPDYWRGVALRARDRMGGKTPRVERPCSLTPLCVCRRGHLPPLTATAGR